MRIFNIGYVLVTVFWMSSVLLTTFMAPGVGTWPDWLAAVGTIGAFGGTIWIATSEQRRRYHQARLRAHIAGATLLYEVSAIVDHIEVTLTRLAPYEDGDLGEEELRWCRDKMLSATIWTRESLEPLVDFEPVVVTVLVHAAYGLQVTQDSLRTFNSGDDPLVRLVYAQGTSLTLRKTLEGLNFAVSNLAKYHMVDGDVLNRIHASS